MRAEGFSHRTFLNGGRESSRRSLIGLRSPLVTFHDSFDGPLALPFVLAPQA
jgi:hypothetical protein